MSSPCKLPLESEAEFWTISRSFALEPLTTLQFSAYCLCAPVSVAAGALAIYLFRRQKGLRQSPAIFAMWQMISQFIMDLTWMAPGLHYVIYGNVKDNVACHVAGIVALYCVFAGAGYNVSIIIEVFYKIHKPLSLKFSTRAAWYHSLTHFFAMCIALSASATASVGLTEMNNCFFRLNRLDESLWVSYYLRRLFPLAIFFGYKILALLLMCYVFLRFLSARRVYERKMLWKLYSYALLYFCLSLAFPGYLFLHIFQYLADLIYEHEEHSSYLNNSSDTQWTQAACVLGAATGFILCTFRGIGYAYSKWQRRRSAGGSETLSSLLPFETVEASSEESLNPDGIASLYKNMFSEYVLTTLMALHIVFKQKMQQGIRRSRRGADDEVKWKLSNADVEPGPGSFIRSAKLWFRVTLHEYMPGSYLALRELCGLQCSYLAEYSPIRSFSPALNERKLEQHSGNKGGKSNAFIYRTFDRKLIIKTLTVEELKVLLACQKMFNEYYGSEQGKMSFIAKIFGVYTLADDMRADIHFAIMENLVPENARVLAVFDLKGSKRHRLTLRDPTVKTLAQLSSESVYKDMDFKQVFGTLPIVSRNYDPLISQLTNDVTFLESLGVMDYSLLAAIVERGCEGRRVAPTTEGSVSVVFGIIDYLQKFNLAKKLEQVGKRIASPRLRLVDTSCVNPHFYAVRFLGFVAQSFAPVRLQEPSID